MTQVFCKIDVKDSVASITLNEPERMNPFSDGMRAQVLDALLTLMADNAVRVIVLTGAGGQFSAGADVRQMRIGDAPDPQRSRRRLKPLHDIVRAIANGPKPVVCAIEGVAFGAGLSIALSCDYIIAGEGARMGAAFGKIGLAPDCGLLWSMPQRIGVTRTKDLIFTGHRLKSAEALKIGLVDENVEKGRALDRAFEKAKEYLSVAPLSIAATKAAFAEMPGDLEAALAIETHQQPMLSGSADHTEATKAFLEKRAPVFTGR